MIGPRLMPPVIGVLIGLQVVLIIRSAAFDFILSKTQNFTNQHYGDFHDSSADHLYILRKDSIKPGRLQKVQFRLFTGNPQHHNKSVTGESLPGVFFDEELFLIGARLTTSYVLNESQVHVDVFGLPGDSVAPAGSESRCELNTLHTNWTLTLFDEVSKKNRTGLYCQLECNTNESEESNTRGDDCGDPIEMKLIPLNSGDFNQKDTTFIWRCDVTNHLSKPDIMNQVADSKKESSSVRIRLWYRNDTSTPKSFDIVSRFTEFDIPLHTAVVGHGGPQIRSADKGYFPPPGNQPLQIGLCMPMYGTNAIQYLPEFVQHHKNIGIEQIVVGVEATMDSDDLNRTAAVLRPYIDEGFVVLQATGLKTFFNCDPIYNQLHFNHQCLYHFKGLAKYSAMWDLDEYWLPPGRSKKSVDNEKVTHDHVGFSGRFPMPITTRIENPADDQASGLFPVVRSAPLSDRVTSDPLWQNSNYSLELNIQDTMLSIEKYYNDIGCGQRWCFHLLPSYTVYIKKEGGARTGRIGNDFYKRQKNASLIWQKSIVQTRYAMMGGIHLVGSCQYPDDPGYYDYAAEPECLPLRWVSGEAGSLRHFYSVVVYRDADFLESDVIEDEYLSMYSQTVSMQLDRNDGKIVVNHKN